MYFGCGDGNNTQKNDIANAVLQDIKKMKGRFLEREKITEAEKMAKKKGRLYLIPDKIALGKIKQALRDKHTPVWFNEKGNNKKK